MHKNSINEIGMVEGEEAVVESPTNYFEPFIINYAESVGDEIVTLNAFLRN